MSQILLINNGSLHIRALKHLCQEVGRVTMIDERRAASVPPHCTLVLSGGHKYALARHADYYQNALNLVVNHQGPVVGICFGAEQIAYAYGGRLQRLPRPKVGKFKLQLDGEQMEVTQSHQWAIAELPEEFEVLADSESGIEAFHHAQLPIMGLQFHPEVSPAPARQLLLDWLAAAV